MMSTGGGTGMAQVERLVDAIIEIPRGSRNKYEWDPVRGAFRLDRVLYSSVHYPTDYGIVPETHAPDGDPLDILVITNSPTFPGCIVPSRPIGGLDMADEKGSDFKVLAVPVGDPRFAEIHSLEDLASHWLREIETFFATYKMLEPKTTEVRGWHDVAETWRVIDESLAAYAAMQQK